MIAFTGLDSGLLGFSTSLLRYVYATTLTLRVFDYVIARLVLLEGVLYASDFLRGHYLPWRSKWSPTTARLIGLASLVGFSIRPCFFI